MNALRAIQSVIQVQKTWRCETMRQVWRIIVANVWVCGEREWGNRSFIEMRPHLNNQNILQNQYVCAKIYWYVLISHCQIRSVVRIAEIIRGGPKPKNLFFFIWESLVDRFSTIWIGTDIFNCIVYFMIILFIFQKNNPKSWIARNKW